MSLPDLLSALSPSLSQQLRSQTGHTLASIVRINSNTQFALAASELAEFRSATAGRLDAMNDTDLSETFRSTVKQTTYDSYSPLTAKFLEKPCRESTVVDLLAPGLPDFIAKSSSTSGGVSKSFPRYNVLRKANTPESPSDQVPKRTTALLYSLLHDPLDVVDENDCLVKRIHLSFASATRWRSTQGVDPDEDERRMSTFFLDHAAPFATGYIKTWRSFLIMHGLFALSSRALESMSTIFIGTIVEMMRHLDAEFDTVVDCIANGTIPDLDGVAEVRHHLEINISPDPERAAELRSLGRPSSRPGWCTAAWPSLHSIIAVASGSFASSLPSARFFLGPDIKIRSLGYGSAEAFMAFPYDPFDPEHFKLGNENVVEFLDVNKNDSVNAITQAWELESGKQYEELLTTPNGLWRYRIGDIIEVAGFDPKDGTPVIRFVERRNVVMRLQRCHITEKELRSAMSFVATDTLGGVVDWTATLDDRQAPSTIGFFVELAGDEGADATLAPDRILDVLLRSNENISYSFAHGGIRRPTVRIVGRGTFSDFRQMKIDEGNRDALGQIKVPVVLPKADYVTWFSSRVVKEL